MTEPVRVVELVGEAATEALGRRLGAGLARGDLVALDGELGAGKTTLVRGLAAGLGLDPAAVRSPTFVLHHAYGAGEARTLHHLDLYRLGEHADVVDLDLDALLSEGVVVVEWARLASVLPPVALAVELRGDRPGRRTAVLRPTGPPRITAALAGEAQR